MNALQRQQAIWDVEGPTIDAGRPACAPVRIRRPAGQPGMLVGAGITFGVFLLLPFIAAILP